MSYVANQYNYATPLSSAAGLVSESSMVSDAKYFALSDNTLDGTYFPITGDVGVWSTTIADANGALATPFVVTVTENLSINAFRLVGSQYNYPVAFTARFYNGDNLLYTITEAANNDVEYVHYMAETLNVTSYEVTVTKISQANAAARLYNMYNPGYVKRADILRTKTAESNVITVILDLLRTDQLLVKSADAMKSFIGTTKSVDSLKLKETSADILYVHATAGDAVKLKSSEAHNVLNTIDVARDALRIKQLNSSHILNTIDVTKDTLRLKAVEDISHVINIFDPCVDTLKVTHLDEPVLTNVHSRMKDPSRRIYGKVYITYTDPILESETTVETNMEAYNSDKEQVMDGTLAPDGRYFTLYDNKLTGEYAVMTEQSQVGWVSSEVSDENGSFSEIPYLQISFSTRPVTPLTIYFDDSHGGVAEDFVVEFVHSDGTSTIKEIVGNAAYQVLVNEDAIMDVDAVIVKVTKMSKPNYPVAIIEVPVLSTILYKGYKDHSDLMSIDLLEELTYEDDVEALGGVSANETTVVIDNSDMSFYFNNKNSAVSKQLRRNRRIEPWLGTEIIPGEIEWYKLGTFWSYSWNVPVNSLTATVVGFDTIGLLDTTSYTNHQVYVDASIGELIEIVLSDAKQTFDFLAWKIDPTLYDVVIPFSWFDAKSHTTALRKISQCYPMHIYCDRDGNICAAPQKLKLDFYYDTWSDSTNVLGKDYSSLYTTLPNLVNVQVKIPQLVDNDTLVQDNLVFNIATAPTRTLNFSKPAVSDVVVTVDKDNTVSYTYETYSWGIVLNFAGTGNVRSITCVGTALDVSNTSTLTRRNDESIRLNGAVTRNVSADFIQTSELAALIIERIFTLSEDDRYDATVTYRGDIALTINDPILLQDGIAPDNRYNIRRHQLSWNGSLTGTADLNT